MNSGRVSLVVAASVAALSLGSGAGSATPQAPVIALSNAYFGNTWRHQMVEAFEAAAKEAKSRGKDLRLHRHERRQLVAQQNSQIGELILKNVDVLARERRFRDRGQRRDREGVRGGHNVVSFDSIANAPCNYQLNFDFMGYKAQQRRR